jgi:HEAT repeat protein
MKTHKRISSLMLAALGSLVLVAEGGSAFAGRGGSYGKILGAVRNGSPDAIVAELERAEKIPCPTACMDLVGSLLDDDRYQVREAAAWWFAKRPAQMTVLMSDAIATLSSTTDSDAARNAADVLGTFRRPDAVAVLSATVNRGDLTAEARSHITKALGTIGHQAANPALAVAMSDANAAVRYQAVVAWGEIRHQVGAAPVAALVGDADLAVQRAAIAIVGKFAQASARGSLEQVLATSSDAATRRNAAWALGQIGDSSSRDALERATSDSSSLVRMSAKAAIRNLR